MHKKETDVFIVQTGAVVMANVALQLQLFLGNSVNTQDNVVFDNVMLQDGSVDYDQSTGVVTLEETGQYLVQWWIATQTYLSTDGALFTIRTSEPNNFMGNTPIKTGVASGFIVLNAPMPNMTFSLVNATNTAVFYSPLVPVKAMLALVKIPEAPMVPAYGNLYALAPQSISLLAGEAEIVVLEEEAVNANVSYGSNSIVIQENGVYRVDFDVTGWSGGGSDFVISVVINGQPNQMLSHSVPAVSTSRLYVGFGLITLVAGDVLELTLTSVNSGVIQLDASPNAALCVQRIS